MSTSERASECCSKLCILKGSVQPCLAGQGNTSRQDHNHNQNQQNHYYQRQQQQPQRCGWIVISCAWSGRLSACMNEATPCGRRPRV